MWVCEEVIRELDGIGQPFEVICVNDGSKDATAAKLQSLADTDRRLLVINLQRNFGQTAAIMAGFDNAHGDVVIVMDGDGQNDPSSIPDLLAKIDEGVDVASGWRVDRQDKLFSRRLPSVVANRVISAISGVRLHDYGCSLKAYRREMIDGVRLYGEMHRLIPIYAKWQGAVIDEVPVKHRARLHGASKYSLNRIYKVLLDLVVVSFMDRFLTKPIYVFGGLGLILLLVAGASATWALVLKLFYSVSFISTPLPVLIGMFFSSGIICLLMGVLAEMIIRVYFESRDIPIYLIKSRLNFPNQDP